MRTSVRSARSGYSSAKPCDEARDVGRDPLRPLDVGRDLVAEVRERSLRVLLVEAPLAGDEGLDVLVARGADAVEEDLLERDREDAPALGTELVGETSHRLPELELVLRVGTGGWRSGSSASC